MGILAISFLTRVTSFKETKGVNSTIQKISTTQKPCFSLVTHGPCEVLPRPALLDFLAVSHCTTVCPILGPAFSSETSLWVWNMAHLKATLNDIEVHGSNFANSVLIFYILWWMLWLRSLHRWCWAVVVKVVVDLPRKECLVLLAEYSASVSKDWCGLVWWIMMYMIMYAQQAPFFWGSWSIFYNMSLYYIFIIIVNISIHIIKYHTNLSNEIAIPKN